MDDDVFDFDEVENQRKKKLNALLKKLADKRKEANKKFEMEFYKQDFNNHSAFKNKKSFSYEKSRNETYDNTNDTKFQNQNINHNTFICHSTATNKIVNYPKQKIHDSNSPSQLSNMIINHESGYLPTRDDKTITKAIQVNIPITNIFTFKHVFIPRFTEIEKSILDEKEIMDKKEMSFIKLEINKRLNQVSDDINKIKNLAGLLKNYANRFLFIEIFSLKMLEQSVIQISRHFESFKSYSFLFYLLYSDDLFLFYKFNLFTKESNISTIKGLYSVYFGVLELSENYTEIWNFIAGLLNSDCNESSFVVLETYLQILGNYIDKNCRTGMIKLIKYIRMYIIQKIEDQPQKYRIEQLLKKLN